MTLHANWHSQVVKGTLNPTEERKNTSKLSLHTFKPGTEHPQMSMIQV